MTVPIFAISSNGHGAWLARPGRNHDTGLSRSTLTMPALNRARSVGIERNLAVAGPVALTPDGRELALGGSIQEVWDLDAGKPIQSLRGDSTFLIAGLAYNAHGKYLAVGESFFRGKAGDFASGLGHRVILLDRASGVQQVGMEDEDAFVNFLAFSQDSKQILGNWRPPSLSMGCP